MPLSLGTKLHDFRSRTLSLDTKLKIYIPLSPEGNCESGVREGPIDSLSILYVIDDPKLGLQKYPSISALLKIPKTFIVRVGGLVDGWMGGDQKVF